MTVTSGTTLTGNREYSVIDEGDSFELALFDDGVQVGGCMFPILRGVDDAYRLALLMGESFVA